MTDIQQLSRCALHEWTLFLQAFAEDTSQIVDKKGPRSMEWTNRVSIQDESVSG